jgi:hypothetical protein
VGPGPKIKTLFCKLLYFKLRFRLIFNYDHRDSQNWGASANFNPYMKNIGPGIIHRFIFENGTLVDNMAYNSSEPLHFRHSVVVPNHIFIAFSYRIYKFLVLNFYLIYFFIRTENNNVIMTTIDLPTYKYQIRLKHVLTRTYTWKC